ncbi:MAG: Asp23/Gls24 family envelope stress response protein [Bacillota bacterium]|nr:Asp23/Gls24 family envelope stress response protein [Bacillota bacterium]
MEKNISGIGELKISEDVIAKIVSVAVSEIDGVSGLATKGIITSKKNVAKGIKVEEKDGELSIDVAVMLNYGVKIHELGARIQDDVSRAVETMTGITPTSVNVYVQGVSFEGVAK